MNATHPVEPAPAEEAQPKFVEELQKMPYEPLLPIEKKLIVWSLSLGVFLLVALVWVSQTFFRANP